MRLLKVYHWSPIKNRESILKDGIKLFMDEYVYENPETGEQEVWKAPYICTSLEPWTALIYVYPTFDERNEDIKSLDLFEVGLRVTDKVFLRNDRTTDIIEVRIENSIPADRVTYIATREL